MPARPPTSQELADEALCPRPWTPPPSPRPSSTPPPGAPTAIRGLTRRQREILQLYADGLSTESAAQRLGLSTETVRTHTKGVLARLEARDRAHAVAIGLRNALIE